MNKLSKVLALVMVTIMTMVFVAGCATDEPAAETAKTEATETTQKADGGEATEATEAMPDAWVPEEDITIRVPAAAGGGFDTYVRIFAQGIQESLDTTTIVANLPGANGSIAAADLNSIDASPYEIMGGNIGMFTTAPLFTPANALNLEDYELIGSLASGEIILYASPKNTGIETFEDLLAYAEDNDVLLGTQPPGNAVQAIATALMGEAGIEFTNIISDGANKDIISVVSGDITLSLGYPNVGRQYVQEGSIVPLLTFSKEPSTAFEGIEVPTATSKGYDFVFRANNFLMAKKGADANALSELYEAFVVWQETDAFKELAASTQYEPYNQTGQDLKAEIEDAAGMFKEIFEKYYQ